jgi:hypothetical protein
MTRFRARTGAIRSIILGALGALFLCGLTPSAQAKVNVALKALPPPEPSDKNKNPSPPFEAAIKGAVPGLAADAFELKQLDIEPTLTVKADKVKTYVESTDKMALVLLIEGNGRWMGNETYAEEAGEVPEAGAFTGLGAAIAHFASAGPPGSLATVMFYGDGKADAKFPMGDASKLSAGIVGRQQDYEKNLDIPLLAGLKAAIAALDQQGGYRKILVIIGDGTGERDDIAGDLNARVEELKARKIEVYTIFYEATPSGDPTLQGNMTKLGLSGHYNADSKDSISTYAKAIVDEIGARYYVDFPGCDASKPPRCFTHDGTEREFVVLIQGTETEPVFVQTKLWNPPKPPKETSLWWLWLLLILLVVGVLVVILVKRAQSREVIVQPPPMEMPEPEPPPAAGPAKTIMLGIGGNDDSMPVVGWVVPLSGPNQFQTFKLMQGVTKIGSGGDSNIIIQDGFMSGEHAQFVMSPTGFILKDGGSTNGTYVNERRIDKHELVDNDVFTMGKTSFKFKSIN